MRQVWKFPVPVEDHFAVDMPERSRILTVQIQREQPQMWALCPPEGRLERRFFRLAGTGHPIEETDLNYVGTFQLLGGALVFHLFEVAPPKG